MNTKGEHDKNGKFIKRYNSISHASRITKIAFSSIWVAVSKYRTSKTAGGFIWKFETKKATDDKIISLLEGGK